ncbi:MAG: hypothetical protein HFE63_00700 [Clostridiales bacterium]|nr:hypothetical protein [Clostridiales bacterium]
MKKLSRTALISVYIIIRAIILISGIRAFLEGHIYASFQCLLTLLLLFLPSILDRRFNIELPNALEISVILFIFASTFLGEVQGYYEQFPLWDSMLHTVSGFLTAAIGFSLIDILNRSEHTKFTLSVGFSALFAFCFSMTVGVIWEFYEFGMDMLFSTDMQKDVFINSISSELIGSGKVYVESAMLNGNQLQGWLDIGLIDTMKDLIVCAVGAIVFSIFGIIYLKTRESGWVQHFMPRSKKQKP